MNSDLAANMLGGVATLAIVVIKLIMFSHEVSMPVFYYILNMIFAYAFWKALMTVADLISGKDYFRATNKFGVHSKIYKKETPLRFYLILFILILVVIFLTRIMFSVIMLDLLNDLVGAWMNPNLVAGVATLLVAATKLIMLSQEGSMSILYFLNAIFVYVFWGSILPISYAISGKNYILISPKNGPDYKAYRKESPFKYYLDITISTLFAAFALGILLGVRYDFWYASPVTLTILNFLILLIFLFADGIQAEWKFSFISFEYSGHPSSLR